MPWRKVTNTDIRYALICFDENGAERRDDRDALGECLARRCSRRPCASTNRHLHI